MNFCKENGDAFHIEKVRSGREDYLLIHANNKLIYAGTTEMSKAFSIKESSILNLMFSRISGPSPCVISFK